MIGSTFSSTMRPTESFTICSSSDSRPRTSNRSTGSRRRLEDFVLVRSAGAVATVGLPGRAGCKDGYSRQSAVPPQKVRRPEPVPGRHANGSSMRCAYHPDYFVPLPPSHPFPMAKYPLLFQRLRAAGWLHDDEVLEPGEAALDDLRLVHTEGYLQQLADGTLDAAAVRKIGVPWSQALWRRSRLAAQGTLLAARAALDDGLAANLAGGTHHAFPGHGEGFCVVNDVAVAIRVLQRDGRVRRALVIDLDVHPAGAGLLPRRRRPARERPARPPRAERRRPGRARPACPGLAARARCAGGRLDGRGLRPRPRADRGDPAPSPCRARPWSASSRSPRARPRAPTPSPGRWWCSRARPRPR